MGLKVIRANEPNYKLIAEQLVKLANRATLPESKNEKINSEKK